jgi:hypothetical protein
MMNLLKKLFFPSATDRQVKSINAESKAMLEDSNQMARRHIELLKKNGVTLRVYIATGEKHGR